MPPKDPKLHDSISFDLQFHNLVNARIMTIKHSIPNLSRLCSKIEAVVTMLSRKVDSALSLTRKGWMTVTGGSAQMVMLSLDKFSISLSTSNQPLVLNFIT